MATGQQLAGSDQHQLLQDRQQLAGQIGQWGDPPEERGEHQPEAFFTLSTIDPKSPSLGLLLKVQESSKTEASAIRVEYDAGASKLRPSAIQLNDKSCTLYLNQAASFAIGDALGARALNNGTVEVYKNGTLVARVTLNAADQAFFNAKDGKIGLWRLTSSTTWAVGQSRRSRVVAGASARPAMTTCARSGGSLIVQTCASEVFEHGDT